MAIYKVPSADRCVGSHLRHQWSTLLALLVGASEWQGIQNAFRTSLTDISRRMLKHTGLTGKRKRFYSESVRIIGLRSGGCNGEFVLASAYFWRSLFSVAEHDLNYHEE